MTKCPITKEASIQPAAEGDIALGGQQHDVAMVVVHAEGEHLGLEAGDAARRSVLASSERDHCRTTSAWPANARCSV